MENKIDKIKLDPTLKWEIAEIVNLDESKIQFRIINKKESDIKEEINLNNLGGHLQKKNQFRKDLKLAI